MIKTNFKNHNSWLLLQPNLETSLKILCHFKPIFLLNKIKCDKAVYCNNLHPSSVADIKHISSQQQLCRCNHHHMPPPPSTPQFTPLGAVVHVGVLQELQESLTACNLCVCQSGKYFHLSSSDKGRRGRALKFAAETPVVWICGQSAEGSSGYMTQRNKYTISCTRCLPANHLACSTKDSCFKRSRWINVSLFLQGFLSLMLL